MKTKTTKILLEQKLLSLIKLENKLLSLLQALKIKHCLKSYKIIK